MKFQKVNVIKLLILILFLSAFAYSINDSKKEIDSKSISNFTGVVSLYRPVGARTYNIIVSDSKNKRLKFLCYRDSVEGYLRSGSFCFSQNELIELKGKLATVSWYPRNVGLLISRKQILSVATFEGRRYVVAEKYVKNNARHIFVTYLIFLLAILGFIFSKNTFRKHAN